MAFFNNLRISAKLALSFGILVVLMLVLGSISLIQISKVNDSTVDIVNNDLSSIRVLGAMGSDVSAFRRFELNYFIATDQQALQEDMAGMTAALISLQEDQKAYEPTVSEGEERGLYNEFLSAWGKYMAVHKQVFDLFNQGKRAEAIRLGISDARAAYQDAVAKLQDDVILNDKQSRESAKAAAHTYSASRFFVFGLLSFTVVVAALVSTFISRSISSALGSMVGLIEQVSANNLTVDDLHFSSHDEIGRAVLALNRMKNNLRDLIQSISGTAQHVAAASEEFSATSQQITANSEETSAQANTVSAATEQVSRSLQTVATGAEEMGTTIKDIAKNASEAAKVAGDAVKTAQSTNAIVSKLGDSSAEIGQVVKVITSIAQQTNLLALNATIEAARAGEAGKGFAVVANEVKELAKQTAKATGEISQKISAIQEDTRGAVEAIAAISGVIDKISDISNTIAAAVEEQSATTNEMTRNVTEAAKGSGAISENISGVAQAAQSTSSSAHQTQKAAADLAQMSTQLRRLVDQFKVDANGYTKSDRSFGQLVS